MFDRKHNTAMRNYNDKTIPTLKKELSKNKAISQFEHEMDNEVSSINYHSLPMSPAKMVRDIDNFSSSMPPLMETASLANESTTKSKKV